MNWFKSLTGALLATGLALATGLPAQAADLQSTRPAYSTQPNYGPCGNARYLNRIVSGFRYQVRHVPNLPQLEIHDFSNVHENRYLPKYAAGTIGRRYCGATALMSDGQHKRVWYMIEEGQGLASIGNNVEFCVDGFDRWNVYNSYCRVLR
ncbi:MAG: hypothetical protein ACRECW_14315 [Phyllobacterium sp.]